MWAFFCRTYLHTVYWLHNILNWYLLARLVFISSSFIYTVGFSRCVPCNLLYPIQLAMAPINEINTTWASTWMEARKAFFRYLCWKGMSFLHPIFSSLAKNQTQLLQIHCFFVCLFFFCICNILGSWLMLFQSMTCYTNI